MKVVTVMFDTLNRRMLEPYGCDWTHTPNFQRLADNSVTFDNSYVCSMPCMPARRDFHTGRPNFLHRSWGPLEPWDESFAAHLHKNGVYTHMDTDHQHYFEDGGTNYHTKFSSWQFFRGQEGDPYFGQVKPEPPIADSMGRNAQDDWWHGMDRKNRKQVKTEADFPMVQTMSAGIDFIKRNQEDDNWFLHIETFDPHEPFFSDDKYKAFYAEHYEKWRGTLWDWPGYQLVEESPEEIDHMRHEYASLLTMCDAQMGRILDTFDELNLWEDTMLIVCTDHGFLLGEHDCWAKCWAPFFNEVAHTPFFIWDPRAGIKGERRKALVQPALDLAPTLQAFFGVEAMPHMTGKDLSQTIIDDTPVRDAAIYGIHGGHVNVTDGRYCFMAGPQSEENAPLYQYTLRPSHMRSSFGVHELQEPELSDGFDFTKGCKMLKLPNYAKWNTERYPDFVNSRLFDLEEDPGQLNNLDAPEIKDRMIKLMIKEMQNVDAPSEQYERLGVTEYVS